MSILKIIKLETGAFLHNDSIDGDFFLGKFYFKQEFNKAFIVEAYGAKRRTYLINEIKVFDFGGTEESFTNWSVLFNRLTTLGYNGIETNGLIPANIETTANKTDVIVGNETSSIKYPSVKGVVDWVTALIPSNGETTANKTDVVVGNETSSIKYPSIKGLVDWVTLLFVPKTRTLTINGTTQDLSANRTFTVSGVDNSPKATNLLIVNSNLNGVINYGHMSSPSLSGGTFVNANGRISGLAVTNMRSTASTVGSFTALTWQNFASLPAKSKAVGFFAIGTTSAIATSRTFAGYYNAGFTLNNINYSTACYAGFLNDTADTNLQFCRVVAGGATIKTDLGSNFPARYTRGENEYKFLIEIVSATTVNYKIKNLITGNMASGTFSDLALVGSVNLAIAMNNNTTPVQTDLTFHSLIYQENYEF